jgi:hypothetical protein
MFLSGNQNVFNEIDPSISLRHDVALYLNGALFLKGVQKARQEDLEKAKVELVDTFHSTADRVSRWGVSLFLVLPQV